MEPTRDSALVDLLDRMLVKGVVLHADVVISVSGIPLVGISLKAAIAGMKTMLDYGIMEAWDDDIRRYALKNSIEEALPEREEEIASNTLASCTYRSSSLRK